MAESKAEAADRLARAVAEVRALRAADLAHPARREATLALKRWQSGRLARTYDDLLASARHGDAARFFFEDLYGPKDFSKRDADVARILPKLRALLPAAALSTIADALELDCLSEELDQALATSAATAIIDEDGYAAAYRASGNRAGRERQITLMRGIGNALDGLTRIPMLETSVKLMRGPARLAGIVELQNFLERGFVTFRKMNGAREFLDIVQARETRLMERLFGGIADPFAGVGPPAEG